jgi:hypothetical protein
MIMKLATGKYTILLGLLLLSVSSCRRSFHAKLCHFLDKKTKNGPAVIKVNSITDFAWDTVFMIHGVKNQAMVLRDHGIQVKEECIGDDWILYVFFKDGKNVHEDIAYEHDVCYFAFQRNLGVAYSDTNYVVSREKQGFNFPDRYRLFGGPPGKSIGYQFRR